MHSNKTAPSPQATAENDLSAALDAWRMALGAQAVLEGAIAEARYGTDTSSLRKRIDAAILPASREEVQAAVRIAHQYTIALYPISTGRNWGYGTANPSTDHNVIVDLSRLCRIVAMDEELGLVTVEPGVTQGSLRSYLDARALPFMVPVTGAGPACSLLGNAVERGYGITPCADHFMAVTSLEAVLPSGELYRSPLAEMGKAEHADHVFKWGIGPYLDGLFTQGNFGIVTQMTFALTRRPEKVKAFYFWLEQDAHLERVVVAVREVLRIAGANVGGINLMSDVRVLAMSIPYPRTSAGKGGAMSSEDIAKIAKKNGVAPWTGVGSIYGSRYHVAATCRIIKRLLAPHVKRIVFADSARVRAIRAVLRILPRKLVSNLLLTTSKMASGLELMEGTPNEVALPLAYWKSEEAVPQVDLNPARDRCGLLWYAPIVPMRAEAVRRYVDMARDECAKHGIEPAITLTSLSERAFDSTLPILFSREAPENETRALACYRSLFDAGQKEGFLPYRTGVQFMHLIVNEDQPFWRLNQRLQRAIDPTGIFAPGRYSIHKPSTAPVQDKQYSDQQMETTA